MAGPEPLPDSRTTASAEFPAIEVLATQADRYRFELRYPGTSLAAAVVDEGPPLGGGAGPDPARALAGAVGHCLSSTLFNTLERSRIPSTPIRAKVRLEFGRNARGRKRVAGLTVEIDCAPVNPADRERFDRAVSIFEDYCTVTGSVREGVRVDAKVQGSSTRAVPESDASSPSGAV